MRETTPPALIDEIAYSGYSCASNSLSPRERVGVRAAVMQEIQHLFIYPFFIFKNFIVPET
jgi:hypothetical protein